MFWTHRIKPGSEVFLEQIVTHTGGVWSPRNLVLKQTHYPRDPLLFKGEIRGGRNLKFQVFCFEFRVLGSEQFFIRNPKLETRNSIILSTPPTRDVRVRSSLPLSRKW